MSKYRVSKMSTADNVQIRPFPQLVHRASIKNTRLKALYSRAVNNEYAFRFLNRQFLQAYNCVERPHLNVAGHRVAAELKAHGIAFASLDEFFPAEMLKNIQLAFKGYLDTFLSERDTKGGEIKGKEIIIDTIHKAHHFVPDDLVSSYLANEHFAGIAADYMGMVPRYIGSSFWHTKPAPSGERQYSQLWHRDYNDRRLVKFFLYLNDVGQKNGYFEYVTDTHVGGGLGKMFDKIGPDSYRAYPDQDAVDKTFANTPVINFADLPVDQRSGPKAPWAKERVRILCTAPAGSLIFCDTFGIHRGGFIQEGYRDLIMGTYSTNFNVHKPHFSVSNDFAAKLSPFMKMVFGVS